MPLDTKTAARLLSRPFTSATDLAQELYLIVTSPSTGLVSVSSRRKAAPIKSSSPAQPKPIQVDRVQARQPATSVRPTAPSSDINPVQPTSMSDPGPAVSRPVPASGPASNTASYISASTTPGEVPFHAQPLALPREPGSPPPADRTQPSASSQELARSVLPGSDLQRPQGSVSPATAEQTSPSAPAVSVRLSPEILAHSEQAFPGINTTSPGQVETETRFDFHKEAPATAEAPPRSPSRNPSFPVGDKPTDYVRTERSYGPTLDYEQEELTRIPLSHLGRDTYIGKLVSGQGTIWQIMIYPDGVPPSGGLYSNPDNTYQRSVNVPSASPLQKIQTADVGTWVGPILFIPNPDGIPDGDYYYFPDTSRRLAKVPGGGIPAISSGVPGSAVCWLMTFDGTAAPSQDVQVTVYNISNNAIAFASGNPLIQVKKIDGLWFADMAPC